MDGKIIIFTQRANRFFWIISAIFFSILTIGGIYGYFFSPEYEIKITQILIICVFLSVSLTYSNSNLRIEFHPHINQIKIYDQDTEIFNAFYKGDLEKNSI
ncbi:hypothetical protein, partial [Roseibium sp. RKSG952]|uniref:hypothetical protein n=1 Tax=Roseibium sp. RKSG952 TaxID=2529384 RepID=UPI001AD925AB